MWKILASGGDLFYHIQKERRFSEEKSRFYSAELILGIGPQLYF
jgi:hypothetical protein